MPDRAATSPSQPIRFVIVAPTYNHAASLGRFLPELAGLGLPVIVVDDGSRDGTADLLKSWARPDRGLVVVHHASNRGKAGALRSGFAEAESRGFTHAATIDSDGQHSANDLHAMLDASLENPSAIVIGARPARLPGYPLTGRIGRSISNFLIRVESGTRVSDSQSGMRVYPLKAVASLHCRAQRYAYESEVLTRAGWAGIPVLELPISCTYSPSGGRVSHFRIGRDSIASLAMHAWLMGRAVFRGRRDARSRRRH